jgi:hypothetical protein
MAAYNFPTNPTDGQLYPGDPVPPGVVQYIWSGTKGTWLTISTSVQQVKGEAPIEVKGSRQVPIVSMPPASQTANGYMTAADKKKLDETVGGVRSVTAGIGLGAPATGDVITESGILNVLPATSITIGGVRPGPTMQVAQDGQINAKVATPSFAGIVRPGQGLAVTPDGTLNSTGGLIVLRDISPGFNGIQTAFTLQRLDGTVYFPVSANQLMIFINGLILIPGNGYGVNGSQIVFTQAPATGATFYGVAIT